MRGVVQVTKYQLIMQLKAVNKLSQFFTFISGLAQDDDVRIEWDYKPTVRRDGLLVAAIKQQAGFTDAQIDTFFSNAADIE